MPLLVYTLSNVRLPGQRRLNFSRTKPARQQGRDRVFIHIQFRTVLLFSFNIKIKCTCILPLPHPIIFRYSTTKFSEKSAEETKINNRLISFFIIIFAFIPREQYQSFEYFPLHRSLPLTVPLSQTHIFISSSLLTSIHFFFGVTQFPSTLISSMFSTISSLFHVSIYYLLIFPVTLSVTPKLPLIRSLPILSEASTLKILNVRFPYFYHTTMLLPRSTSLTTSSTIPPCCLE